MLCAVLFVVGLALLGAGALTWPEEPQRERVALLPEPPPPAPFPLVVPARAGWGTLLDLSMTSVFRPSWAGVAIEPDRIIDVT